MADVDAEHGSIVPGAEPSPEASSSSIALSSRYERIEAYGVDNGSALAVLRAKRVRATIQGFKGQGQVQQAHLAAPLSTWPALPSRSYAMLDPGFIAYVPSAISADGGAGDSWLRSNSLSHRPLSPSAPPDRPGALHSLDDSGRSTVVVLSLQVQRPSHPPMLKLPLHAVLHHSTLPYDPDKPTQLVKHAESAYLEPWMESLVGGLGEQALAQRPRSAFTISTPQLQRLPQGILSRPVEVASAVRSPRTPALRGMTHGSLPNSPRGLTAVHGCASGGLLQAQRHAAHAAACMPASGEGGHRQASSGAGGAAHAQTQETVHRRRAGYARASHSGPTTSSPIHRHTEPIRPSSAQPVRHSQIHSSNPVAKLEHTEPAASASGGVSQSPHSPWRMRPASARPAMQRPASASRSCPAVEPVRSGMHRASGSSAGFTLAVSRARIHTGGPQSSLPSAAPHSLLLLSLPMEPGEGHGSVSGSCSGRSSTMKSRALVAVHSELPAPPPASALGSQTAQSMQSVHVSASGTAAYGSNSVPPTATAVSALAKTRPPCLTLDNIAGLSQGEGLVLGSSAHGEGAASNTTAFSSPFGRDAAGQAMDSLFSPTKQRWTGRADRMSVGYEGTLSDSQTPRASPSCATPGSVQPQLVWRTPSSSMPITPFRSAALAVPAACSTLSAVPSQGALASSGWVASSAFAGSGRRQTHGSEHGAMHGQLHVHFDSIGLGQVCAGHMDTGMLSEALSGKDDLHGYADAARRRSSSSVGSHADVDILPQPVKAIQPATAAATGAPAPAPVSFYGSVVAAVQPAAQIKVAYMRSRSLARSLTCTQRSMRLRETVEPPA